MLCFLYRVSSVPVPAPLSALSTRQLVEVCARFRPGDLADPGEATRHALRSLARRWTVLHAEVADLDSHIRGLVMAVGPALLQRPGVGVQVAAALLVTVGDNPDRLRSEAAFAHLCGVAPLSASARCGTVRPPRRGPPHQRGAVETREHPLPQALRRPRAPPRDHRAE